MPVENSGRALRPRRETVDYTGTAEASSTPRWMKGGSKSRAENQPDNTQNAEVVQPPRKKARKTGRGAEQSRGNAVAEQASDEGNNKEEFAANSPPKTRSNSSSGQGQAKPAARKKAGKKAAKKGKGETAKEPERVSSEGQTVGNAKLRHALEAANAGASAAKKHNAQEELENVAPDVAEPPQPTSHEAILGSGPEPAAASTSKTFQALQEEYSSLLAKYQDIKAQRIVEVEEAIKQIRAEERAHTQKAVQLATHWEVEAQRQAAVATTGEAAVLRRQLDNLSAENNELRRQLLDSRTEELKKDETIIGLKRKLGELVVLAEAMEELSPSAKEPAPSPVNSEQNTQAASPAAAMSHPGTQQPRGGTPAGSPHIREAAAFCPEGASLSERYMQPPGPVQAEGPTGTVHCVSSAKPLVPYRPGLSVNQAAPKSRFAAEAGSIPQQPESVEASQQKAGNVAQTSAPNTTGQSAERGAIERQLEFTPKPTRTPAAAQQTVDHQTTNIHADAIVDLTDNGLQNLVNLAVHEPRPRGGFSYKHPPTGFVFEIVQDDSEESDEEMGGGRLLVFNPLELGAAEPALPPYFKYEIKFAPAMKTRLVGRVLEYLDQAAR